MTVRQIILITLTIHTLSIQAQVKRTEDDSLREEIRKEQEILRKERSDLFKATIKDSIVFSGQLLDLTAFIGCGHDGQGIAVFKVLKADKNNFPKTVCVVIQCLKHFESILTIGKTYTCKVSPQRIKKLWGDFIWEKYENKKRFYLLHQDLKLID